MKTNPGASQLWAIGDCESLGLTQWSNRINQHTSGDYSAGQSPLAENLSLNRLQIGTEMEPCPNEWLPRVLCAGENKKKKGSKGPESREQSVSVWPHWLLQLCGGRGAHGPEIRYALVIIWINKRHGKTIDNLNNNMLVVHFAVEEEQ